LVERYVVNHHCVACNAIKARIREAERSIEDPSYRMYRNVQRRSGHALRGISPVAAIDCSAPKLKTHIENLFTPGMTWPKYGQWQVDHIEPLSGSLSPADLIDRCHYTNLQPLWMRDNQVKGGA
jgi:hypothetical protein